MQGRIVSSCTRRYTYHVWTQSAEVQLRKQLEENMQEPCLFKKMLGILKEKVNVKGFTGWLEPDV